MKGILLNDLPEKYRKQAAAQLAPKIIHPCKAPNVEQAVGDTLLAKKKTPRFDGQVDISFTEKRHRLADPDGSCVKYVIDALVSCGVLQDDSAKKIRKIEKNQTRVSKNEREGTILEIWK